LIEVILAFESFQHIIQENQASGASRFSTDASCLHSGVVSPGKDEPSAIEARMLFLQEFP
jgi:hypothetical protein